MPKLSKAEADHQDAVDALLEEIVNSNSQIIRVKAEATVWAAALAELPNYPGDYRVVVPQESIRKGLVDFVANKDNSDAWEEDEGPVQVDAHPDTPAGWASLAKEMEAKSYGQTFWICISKSLEDEAFLKAIKNRRGGSPQVVINEA